MKSIFEKWDTANPATGEPRYAVRYWDDEIQQWAVRLKVGAPSLFRTEAERDAWLSHLQKKEKKRRIAGLH